MKARTYSVSRNTLSITANFNEKDIELAERGFKGTVIRVLADQQN